MDFLVQSITLFHKGGPVMYALLLCSFFVVAIAIERFFYYRQITVPFFSFKTQVVPLFDKKSLDEAQDFCDKSSTAISLVASAGVQAYRRGKNAEAAMESAAALMAAKLRERLNYLSTVVTLAPLMGLLGTVIGMISSFSVFNVAAGEPSAITGGVGEALIATATGLCVAILALVVHTYFAQRLDGLITDVEQTIALVTNSLPSTAKERREFHEIA